MNRHTATKNVKNRFFKLLKQNRNLGINTLLKKVTSYTQFKNTYICTKEMNADVIFIVSMTLI